MGQRVADVFFIAKPKYSPLHTSSRGLPFIFNGSIGSDDDVYGFCGVVHIALRMLVLLKGILCPESGLQSNAACKI